MVVFLGGGNMKCLLIMFMSIQFVMADCDFSTIKETDQGYLYSQECHRQVGKLVKDEAERKEQIAKLNKSIELKDLVIDKQEERIKLWMDSTEKMEDRVNSIEKWKSTNQWLYFGLGVVTTSLSVWLASKAMQH